MITIGIVGERGKSLIANAVDLCLEKYGKTTCIIGSNNRCIGELEKLLCSDIDYLIIVLSIDDIKEKSISNIKFNVIIQTFIDNSDDIKTGQDIISCIDDGGYYIFNPDSMLNINFQCDRIYPITYGLNGKTTVTASSIDDIDGLCFSYCLQRSIVTVAGNLIQPFEKPLKTEGEYDNIGFLLAAYTCIIVLGYSI